MTLYFADTFDNLGSGTAITDSHNIKLIVYTKFASRHQSGFQTYRSVNGQVGPRPLAFSGRTDTQTDRYDKAKVMSVPLGHRELCRPQLPVSKQSRDVNI